MKTAIVLSGGGGKGSFQAGVLTSLWNRGIRPDFISGTSVGALNAAAWSHRGGAAIEGIWRSIEGQGSVISPNIFKLIFGSAMNGTGPLKDLIDAQVVGPPICEGIACYVNLRDAKARYVSSSESAIKDYREAVLASASIPFAMDPVHGTWVDGGVREVTPLKHAIDRGAERIIAILCNPATDKMSEWGPSFPKAVSIGLRAVDIQSNEVFLNDLKICRYMNKDPEKKTIELVMIAPDREHMDTLDFDPVKIRTALEFGKSAGADVSIPWLA